MNASLLLVGGAVAIAAAMSKGGDDPAPPAAKIIGVSVRVDCLNNRGVGFSLVPWSVTFNKGDSLFWVLDTASTASSMEIVEAPGAKPPYNMWPFRRRPETPLPKGQAFGVRELSPAATSGTYKYAVKAVCVRTSPAVSDTLLIDPDMIIITGG